VTLPTRERVLWAALDCFDAKGVSATRIAEIQVASGASIGSIYHHFGDKEGIAAALFTFGLTRFGAHVSRRILQEESSEPEVLVRLVVAANVEWICAEPTLAAFVFENRSAVDPSDAQVLEDRTAHLLSMLVKSIEADGSVFRLPQPQLALALVLGPVQEYSRRWMSGRTDSPPSDHLEEFMTAAWKSVKP
jgi:AcrR family transcriptional regulator